MLNILIATGVMNAGGAETLIMEMLRHRSEKVHYVLLIHHSRQGEHGVFDEEILRLGVPMVHIPSVGSLGRKRYIEVFQEKVKSIGQVDILHSHLNAVGGIIAQAAKQAGIPHRIIHCHADITYTGSFLSKCFNESKLWILKRFVRRFGTDFWACSVAAGRRLFGCDKTVKIIPNVIDVQKYLNTNEKREKSKARFGLTGKFVIGSVGRIAPIKNYELALQTTAWLNQHGVATVFVCFGRVVNEEYFTKLKQLAESLSVTDKVHWLGNSSDVSNDISLFDVFLMPSQSEGFGMAALEAQAAGLPTIVSTGVPEIVDMKLELVHRVGFDASQWAEAVLACRNLPAPSQTAILDAFDRKGFNSPTTVRDIEEAYQQICRLR